MYMKATLTEWLSGLGMTSFITTLSPRQIHKLWKRQVTFLDHSTFGGVTDCTQRFYFFTRSQLELNTVDALKHQRDAHTIIDDSISCSRKRRKSVPSIITPLSVQNIGTDKYPIYHIGGLLPCTILPHITIATTGIGLPKETWGIRKLSPIEICDAADISHNLLPSHIPILSFFNDKLIPVRLWMVAGCMTVKINFTQMDSTLTIDPKQLKCDHFQPPSLGICQSQLIIQTSPAKNTTRCSQVG